MPEEIAPDQVAAPATDLPEDITDVERLAEYLVLKRAEIQRQALAPVPGLALARRHSDLVDAVVRRMFVLAHAEAGYHGPSELVPMAVVATGGYGRRELCPHSDVDITFIPARDGVASIDRVVKEMFTALMKVLMDAAKIDVGYAYRLIEDCGQLDHQTVSGLLDARLIAGSRRVFIQFEHEFWSNFNAPEFIFAKLEERRRQWASAGGVPRVVEPDLKIGPGGLRDLQTIVWLIQARECLTAGDVRGDRAWRALARYGGVSDRQISLLKRAKESLLQVRNAIHVLADRETDQLTAARQEEIARVLGYDDSSDIYPAVEQFMRDLYAHLAAVHEICLQVTEGVEHSRLFMGIGLDVVDRRLTPANSSWSDEDPLWMVWASRLAQRYSLSFSPELRAAITEVLAGRPVLKQGEEVARMFTEILSARQPVYPVLQLMADTGILAWILPEFGRALDLIPFDAAHDYTVGQHSLYVIKYLDALRSPGCPEELRELQMVMAELTNPEQLYLAALLHDVGKASPGEAHSDVGSAIAEGVCARLGWSRDAADTVSFLVRHHLLMPETSRLRDLSLPETIQHFTSIVGDTERLRMLYLLAYADTSAVSPGQWTQVKARFLRELYQRAEHALAAGYDQEVEDAQILRTRKRLIKELEVENLPPEEVAAHLEGMPAHYALNTTLEQMALHIAFVRQARQGIPSVSFHDDRAATFTELTVCTRDDPRPGLLAKIAGVLYAADLTVHAAQVYTRVSGDERIAIDTLFVDFRGRRLTSTKRNEVEANLKSVLSGTTTVERLLGARRKAAHEPPAVVHIRALNQISRDFTIVELRFNEAHGILYYAARALSALGWDIHSARLSRFAGKPTATFYVTGAKSLTDAQAEEALRGALGSLAASSKETE